jgi:hypothetical protein
LPPRSAIAKSPATRTANAAINRGLLNKLETLIFIQPLTRGSNPSWPRPLPGFATSHSGRISINCTKAMQLRTRLLRLLTSLEKFACRPAPCLAVSWAGPAREHVVRKGACRAVRTLEEQLAAGMPRSGSHCRVIQNATGVPGVPAASRP